MRTRMSRRSMPGRARSSWLRRSEFAAANAGDDQSGFTVFADKARRSRRRKGPRRADLGDARVGNAKRLFEIRNRVAHSYPDRVAMAVGTMWFDQCFPVLAQAVPVSRVYWE